MKKCALVLAGGGSRGAYQMGVWKALRELNISIDGVFGSSIGALNGALILQDDFNKALDLWQNINVSNVFVDGFDNGFTIETVMNDPRKAISFLSTRIKNKGSSNENLEQFIHSHIDINKLLESTKDLGVVVYNVDERKGEEWLIRELKKELIIDYLVASASCFPAIQMKEIEGKNYIDGGYFDNLPILFARKKGYKEIIAVSLHSVGFERKIKLTRGVRYIEPTWPLGSIFDFKVEDAKNNMTLGYLDTLKSYGIYKGTYYAVKGESEIQIEEFNVMFNEKLNVLKNRISVVERNIVDLIIRKKTLNKHQQTALDLIEVSAKVLGISPYDTLTFEQLIIKLLQQFTIETNKEVPTDFIAKVNSMERKVIVRYLYEQYIEKENYSHEAFGIAMAFKDEMITAVMISICKQYFLEKKHINF